MMWNTEVDTCYSLPIVEGYGQGLKHRRCSVARDSKGCAND